MDPITIAVVVTAGGIMLIDYLRNRKVMVAVNPTELLKKYYKPEQGDIEMLERCQRLLEREFPYPQELCMWGRLQEVMTGLSYEDRKLMLEELLGKAAVEMKLDPVPALEFDDIACYGFYRSSEDKVYLSSSMLKDDKNCVEMVKTIFHELKHTVQWRAIKEGGNVWGYSDDKLVEWSLNWMNYISPQEDPQGYMTQPIEMDAFGFETLLLQNPEHIIEFDFVITGNDTEEAILSNQ